MILLIDKWANELYWHKWFAWRPVIINNKIVWFKTVMRKRHINSFEFQYKLGGSNGKEK